MARLFLVNPPERRGYSNERTLSGGLGVSRKLKFWEKAGLLLPPPDIMLTAAVAEGCDCKVEIVDLILEGKDGATAVDYTLDRIAKSKTDKPIWIGVELSISTLPADLRLSNQLKARLPQARLFLFGSVIQTTLDHWMHETQADALLYGEPEALIGPMLRASGEEWRRQKGVIDPQNCIPLTDEALYDGSQQQRYGKWTMVEDLSTLPLPAYHLLPMERYSPTGKTEDCAVYVTASRGCPIGCTMCPYMLHEGRTLRASSAERVLEEMEWLNKTYGIFRWRFRDPNFGFDRKQAREILTGVIERGIRMDSTVEGSLECMEDSFIELMARAGVTCVTTGIETADEECLASIGQKIKVNSILAHKIALADRLGIHVYGTFVIGAPEESWDSVRRTIDYAKGVPCECTFTVMTPFPGSPMYFRALEEGLLAREMTYEKWNSYEATVRSRLLTADDLTLARLWARLELIIPYRWKRARKAGVKERLKTVAALLPRAALLAWVRMRVAHRRRRGSPHVEPPAHLAGKKIQKIPLHLEDSVSASARN